MSSSRGGNLVSALLFVGGCAVFGFMAGGFLAGRVLSQSTGIDRLMDALGGVVVGTVRALVVSLLLVRSLSGRVRRLVGGTALAISAALFLLIQMLPPAGRPPASPPPVSTTAPTTAPAQP